jgi:hypothetical protein
MAFKGGEVPTGLGSGNDGFSDVKSHVSTYKSPIGEGTEHVGREVTVDVGGSADNGGGKKKGSSSSYAD